MSSTIKIKRRLPGAGATSGAPAVGVEGEIALNFAGGATTTPELYAHGGTLGWLRVNPPVTVTTQSITLATAADIGAAYTAWATTPANRITGNVVIASFTPTGGAAGAYVLTNPAAPGTASWVSLGGAVSMAAGTDVIAGTDTTKALSAKALADGATAAPTAADAGKYLRLGAGGKISAAALPATGLNFAGSVDLTAAYAAPTPAPTTGSIYTVSKTGTLETSWAAQMATLTAGAAVKQGDMVIWDGSKFHHIANALDLSGFVPKAGATTMAADASWTFAPAAAGATIITGGANMPKIDQVTVDCGTF